MQTMSWMQPMGGRHILCELEDVGAEDVGAEAQVLLRLLRGAEAGAGVAMAEAVVEVATLPALLPLLPRNVQARTRWGRTAQIQVQTRWGRTALARATTAPVRIRIPRTRSKPEVARLFC